MTKPETEKLPELPEPFGDFYSDDKCDSLPDVYTADQMRAYALAAIRAKGTIFTNDGTTEAQFIADGELDCPHCGGSGHRDDVRAQGDGATPAAAPDAVESALSLVRGDQMAEFHRINLAEGRAKSHEWLEPRDAAYLTLIAHARSAGGEGRDE